MKALIKKLRVSSDKRFREKDNKKNTYLAQYVSVVLFFLCGLFLPLKYLVLFVSEAVGQFFLAYNNQKTLKAGDEKTYYFDRNLLGYFSALSFSVTAIARFHEVSLVLFSFYCAVSVIYLGLYFYFKRRDEVGFIFVAGSALIAGLVCVATGIQVVFGYFQLAYALLLLIGVIWLKPWVAEILNILLWIFLFVILFFLPSSQI